MNLNQDFVPSNLDEAVKALIHCLDQDDVTQIKNPKNDAIQAHFTWGQLLRNEWSLWDKESRLVIWFKNNYGLEHADDLSGLILDCLWQDMNKRPRRVGELVKKYFSS